MTIIPPSREELCDELARLLASKTFAAARRSRQLLEYFINHLLLGTAEQLKEYSIGVDVFQREPSYNPKLDTIVRTEIWRLRSKLASYYGADGKDNPLRIGFRPRSLVPVAQYSSTHGPTHSSTYGSSDISVTRPSAARLLQRIAVLPFVSIGRKNEAFNDGLATDVIVGLGACNGLQVISRTSSFEFKGQSRNVREIAAKLDAHLLVEGTVQMHDRELRVTTLLTDAASGAHIHSATYDRKTAPSLRMQQDLAQQIAVDIDGALLRRAGEAVGGMQQDTYLESLMRMRFHFKFQTGATAELAESIKYFQAAAQSQPDSRPIRRALSISAGTFVSLGSSSLSEAMPQLLAPATPSGDCDELFLETRVCVGMVAMFKGEYGVAADRLMRAVELHPTNAMTHVALGILLLHAGKLEEALHTLSIGQSLDPLSAINAGMLAVVLFNLRRIDASREQATLCLALDPKNMMAHALLADIEMVSGRHDVALAKHFEFCRLSNGHPLALGKLGYMYGLEGKHAEVQSILNTLLAQADEPGRVAPAIALAYLGLGHTKKALSWMRTAAEQNSLIDMIPSMPFYDALRSDPKFTALIPDLR
jgi:TolB-like protein/Flp pilus assembly protein TadD